MWIIISWGLSLEFSLLHDLSNTLQLIGVLVFCPDIWGLISPLLLCTCLHLHSRSNSGWTERESKGERKKVQEFTPFSFSGQRKRFFFLGIESACQASATIMLLLWCHPWGLRRERMEKTKKDMKTVKGVMVMEGD